MPLRALTEICLDLVCYHRFIRIKLITLFLDLITYSFTVVYYTVRSVFDFIFSAASSLSLLKSAHYLANLCIYIS